MREIKNIGPERIEEYLTVYLNAYPAFKSLDDSCREYYRQKTETDMREDEGSVEFVGLFEDNKLVATMKIVKFSMNFYGRMEYATGLMALAVHPLYKKRGIALEMVRYFEKYSRDTGALAALLLPFDIAFYRRMGYGLGSRMDEYRIPTEGLPACSDLSSMRILSGEDLQEVLSCYTRYAEKNHGVLKKTGEEIRAIESDTQVKRVGCIGEDGQLKGYIAYRFSNGSDVNYTLNHIDVEELIYEDGRTLRKLLGFLRLQADQVQEVVLRSGEEDFYHLLRDPQDVSENYIPFGYLQTNISAVGTMYKILDPEYFIGKTSYHSFPVGEKELIVEFRYEDQLEHAEKTVTVAFFKDSSGEGRWKAAGEDAKPSVSVRCEQGDLAALFLGSCRFSSMVRLGTAEISDNAFTEYIDRLLCCPQKPWTNTDY
ncbi:MAG: enhanced intracellular survival protein Eis [Anaerovoracaceae bacterium]